MVEEGQVIKISGVIGDPIIHSKSPVVQNFWLKKYGILGVYAPFHVPESKLELWIEHAIGIGLAGFNVTLPHKEAMVSLVTQLSPISEASKSVNTVRITKDGLIGDSTDGFGFLENLKQGGFLIQSNKCVALVGAGGAVRAVAAALLDAGLAVRLTNRTEENAERLAADLAPLGHIDVHSWPPSASFFDGADVIANGTPMGMTSGGDISFTIPTLSNHVIATDMVYAPLDTPFLKMARTSGAQTIDGLGMLLHQARPGFAKWFGVEPVVDAEVRKVALSSTGFLP